MDEGAFSPLHNVELSAPSRLTVYATVHDGWCQQRKLAVEKVNSVQGPCLDIQDMIEPRFM